MVVAGWRRLSAWGTHQASHTSRQVVGARAACCCIRMFSCRRLLIIVVVYSTIFLQNAAWGGAAFVAIDMMLLQLPATAAATHVSPHVVSPFQKYIIPSSSLS